MTMNPALTTVQIERLLTPLQRSRITKLRDTKFTHLEAWDVRRHLTRIFGFTGWDFETLTTKVVYQEIKGTRATVVYEVTGRLVVKAACGTVLGHWDDGACGDAQNLSIGDAFDFAIKTAMSQALKRCAVNLGDQFGLSLYNKGQTDAVVIGSLAYVEVAQPMPEDPPVEPEASYEPTEVDARPMRREQRSEPTTDEWSSPAPQARTSAAADIEDAEIVGEPVANQGPKVTQPTHARIAVLLMRKRGLGRERAAVHAALSVILDRTITSATQLTPADADRVIKTLDGEPDFVPGPAPGAVVAEPATSAPDVAAMDEAHTFLLETLRRCIDEADGPGQLKAAGEDIGEEFAKGNITEVERDILRKHWMTVSAKRGGQLVNA